MSIGLCCICFFFFFKQKTAYEMRISDWSSDVCSSDLQPSLSEVEAVLERFTGPIAQVPPVYSALKVDGKRAYDLARAGEAVEMRTRSVVIHRLSIRSDPADGPVKNVTLTAYVSKGTYIRSLRSEEHTSELQ